MSDSDYDWYGVSRETAISVFEYYFSSYAKATGKEHPYLSNSAIEDILSKMSYIDDDTYDEPDYVTIAENLDAEDYYIMIDKHFETPYTYCDWNIVHFFSGDIRKNRFYETLY